MHSSKKGNQWYFGIKAHIGVDADSGLVHTVRATAGVKVEHPFRVIKRQFGHVKVRYRGLKKNTQQLMTLFALSNLWMVRSKLMATQGARGEVRLKTGKVPRKGHKSLKWADEAKQIQAELKENLHRENYRLPN